jgi:hypothetical protein
MAPSEIFISCPFIEYLLEAGLGSLAFKFLAEEDLIKF